MGKEIELKIIGIKPSEAKERLNSINAEFKGHFLLQRVTFQGARSGKINDYTKRKHNDKYHTSWVRVRTDGKKTTLTYKEQRGTGITKRSEYEVEVGNFIETVKILRKAMPNASYNYMVTSREIYVLGKITFTIDKWPLLPYQMEIEGPSEKLVRHAYKELGIKGKLAPSLAVSDEEYYKLHGINYKELISKYNSKLEKLLE